MKRGLAVALIAVLGSGAAYAQPDGGAEWNVIARALNSPRCLNCHPRDDWPTQGDAMKRHAVAAPRRGPHDHGVPAMRCSTCHQERNQEIAGLPGAPHWHLAPASMGWAGLASGALCRAIEDPARNGSRTVAQVATHMREDALVRWAWTPGGNASRRRCGSMTSPRRSTPGCKPAPRVPNEAARP